MSNARDDNFVPNIAGVSSITFAGTVEPAVNPTTHALLVENTSSTTDQEVDIVKVGGSAFALGQQLAASSLPIVLTSSQITTLTPPVAITGFATSSKQDTLLTELQLKADLTETQPVSIATMPSTPVTGTFWQTTQPVSGTVAFSNSTIAVTNTGTFATQETAATTIYNGKKTVTTAATRVTLASSQAVKSVTIKALVANTGTIYVGDGTVAAANGYALSAGDTISLDIANLATVNLDSSINGEGVTYIGIA